MVLTRVPGDLGSQYRDIRGGGQRTGQDLRAERAEHQSPAVWADSVGDRLARWSGFVDGFIHGDHGSDWY